MAEKRGDNGYERQGLIKERFVNKEGQRIVDNWRKRPDLIEEALEELKKEGKIGGVRVPETQVKWYEEQIISASKYLGFEISNDKANDIIKIVDRKRSEKKPEVGDYFPEDEIDLAEAWNKAAIVELVVSPPGSKEEIRQKFLLLNTSMTELLEQEWPGSEEEQKQKTSLEVLTEVMLGKTKINNIPSIFLVPLTGEGADEIEGLVPTIELDKIGTNRTKDADYLTKDRSGELNNRVSAFIRKKQEVADEYVIDSHGFAGKEEYTLFYETIGMSFRYNPDAIFCLPTVMGGKGTMYHIGDNYPEDINQYDQAKELELLVNSYGLYRKKLTLRGHSMGGGAATYFAKLKEDQEEEYKNKQVRWLMKGKEEDESANYWLDTIKQHVEQKAELEKVIEGLFETVVEEVNFGDGKKYKIETERLREGERNRDIVRQCYLKIQQINWQLGVIGERLPDVLGVAHINERAKEVKIIGEAPCLSARDAKKLLSPTRVFGAAVQTGHAEFINKHFKPIVGMAGRGLTKAFKAAGVLKDGWRHNDRHVNSVKEDNKFSPTKKQSEGIRKSVGLARKQDWVRKINECPNFFMICAKGDHVLDYNEQIRELNDWGVDVLMLHVEGDHFAFASPDHAKIVEPWYRVSQALTNQEWDSMITILKKAVYADEAGKLWWLIRRGEDLSKDKEEQNWFYEAMRSSELSTVLRNTIGDKANFVIEALGNSWGKVSFSANREEADENDLDKFNRLKEKKKEKGHELIEAGLASLPSI